MQVFDKVQAAHQSLGVLRSKNGAARSDALKHLSQLLKKEIKQIIEVNLKDLDYAKKLNLKSSLIDRLELNEGRIESMAQSVADLAQEKDILGEPLSSFTKANGLNIKKVRIPIGLIGMICESRPNVVIEAAALAIRSGNGLIFKGGKEAQYSNDYLMNLVCQAVNNHLPQEAFQILHSREEAQEMLGMHHKIDLMIPRGGSSLVAYVRKHATMPVIAHDKGLCHIYIHKDADPKKAIDIIQNAKTQRPGVCNALETLLIHKDFPEKNTIELLTALNKINVELRVDLPWLSQSQPYIKATKDDWDMEYLDQILSIRQVQDMDQAIEHIALHGSHHTEGIITSSQQTSEKFIALVDASCITINASTRFNDGGQLGLGAELGISTQKLHAYGPMGVKEMTSTKFVVIGDGHIRE